jgi:hypothetical protein
VGVFVRVVDGDLAREKEPFDGATLMLDRHAAVVAQQVPDLRVQSFEA